MADVKSKSQANLELIEKVKHYTTDGSDEKQLASAFDTCFTDAVYYIRSLTEVSSKIVMCDDIPVNRETIIESIKTGKLDVTKWVTAELNESHKIAASLAEQNDVLHLIKAYLHHFPIKHRPRIINELASKLTADKEPYTDTKLYVSEKLVGYIFNEIVKSTYRD